MLIDVPGGHINAVIEGAGPLVLFVHGFPEGAWAWRHQLPAFAQAGYTAVAIDVRGYGDSLAPDAVEAYRMTQHVADNVAVLDVLHADTALVVGHDWGSPIAAASAQLRPDRFSAVALLGVPYQPRSATPPRFPPDFYVAHLQTDAAQREIEQDPASWLRRFYAAVTAGTPGWFGNPMQLPEAPLPDWVEDFDAIVAAFTRNGFRGPLNRYRNFLRDWEDLAAFPGLTRPDVFITGEHDSTRLWMPADGEVLPGAGHFVQLTHPDAVNARLLRFAAGQAPPR